MITGHFRGACLWGRCDLQRVPFSRPFSSIWELFYVAWTRCPWVHRLHHVFCPPRTTFCIVGAMPLFSTYNQCRTGPWRTATCHQFLGVYVGTELPWHHFTCNLRREVYFFYHLWGTGPSFRRCLVFRHRRPLGVPWWVNTQRYQSGTLPRRLCF